MSVVGSVFALGVVGSGVTLSFMITNAYPDVPRNNIKWTFNNGQNISDITGLTTNGFSFSMDLLSLSIVGISSRHEGNYTLTATNNAGNGQASIELEVEGMCENRLYLSHYSINLLIGDIKNIYFTNTYVTFSFALVCNTYIVICIV